MSNPTMIDRIRQASDKLAGTDDSVLSYAHFKMTDAIKAYVEAENKVELSTVGHKYGASSLNRLVKAEAEVRLWYQVVANSSPSQDDIQVTKEGLEQTVTEVGADVLNTGGRSTDAFANAIQEVEREVKAEFIRSFGRDMTVGQVSRW